MLCGRGLTGKEKKEGRMREKERETHKGSEARQPPVSQTRESVELEHTERKIKSPRQNGDTEKQIKIRARIMVMSIHN